MATEKTLADAVYETLKDVYFAEKEEDLEDFGAAAADDAVLIGCGQALEPYEIALSASGLPPPGFASRQRGRGVQRRAKPIVGCAVG